jgi:NADH-quinone oxidoreductase subunit G
VLGTMLGLPGFEFDTAEQVREACLAGRDLAKLLSNDIAEVKAAGAPAQGLQRIADVPIYFADPLVRRAPSLQKTRDARKPRAWMNAKLLQSLGVQPGGLVLARQGQGEAGLTAALDDKLPDGCVRIAAAHPATAALGPMFGTLTLERITAERAA